MGMFSLVVSITFVILTLQANQLGPRLIHTFFGDRRNQNVLGLFLGTILYVLVVLRSPDETLGPEGVPYVAVTIGSVLTVVCLLALLSYVHRVACSIVADNVVAGVAGDLHNNIRSMIPEAAESGDTVPEDFPPTAGSMSLGRSGYIQVIDYDKLVSVACKKRALLQASVRAGHFVLEGGKHVAVHATRPLGDAAFNPIRQAAQEIPALLIRMADVLGQLASIIRPEKARDAVVQHLDKLAETAEAARPAPRDRTAILERIDPAGVATSARAKEAGIHVL